MYDQRKSINEDDIIYMTFGMQDRLDRLVYDIIVNK